MKLLVTGGAGFIGGNFARYMARKYPHYTIGVLDKLTYAGNRESLVDLESHPNFRFLQGDITNVCDVDAVFCSGIDAVVHFAAESHVDRSILNPNVFVQTNVLGTQNLLEAARRYGLQKFVQVSTDEVYGTLDSEGEFTECSPVLPNSPYSASKASADMLARAYHRTFGVPVTITRCSNNYGPYQFPEKLIPFAIIKALADERVPVYGDGLQIRDWMHVDDHVSAIDLVLHKGVAGELYNIGASNEQANVDIVKLILNELGKPYDLIEFVADRPGHDRRYAIDSSKIQREIGWVPQIPFEEGLSGTVQWYLQNQSWWKRVQTREYRSYLTTQYGSRKDDQP